jgi:hypothetical protein
LLRKSERARSRSCCASARGFGLQPHRHHLGAQAGAVQRLLGAHLVKSLVVGQRQRKVAGPLFDLRGDLVQAVQGVEAAAAGALHDAIVRSLARRRQVATAQVNARNGRSGVQRAERFAHGLRQRAVAQQHVQRFVGAAQAGQRGAQVGHVHLLQARHGAVFGDGHGLAAVLDGSLERLARRGSADLLRS